MVIQMHAGDSTTAIGETLHNQRCGRTVKAFVEAAHGNDAISAIQPGYYRMRTEIPAAIRGRSGSPTRAAGWASWSSPRVSSSTTPPTSRPTRSTPGIFTLISRATCVDLDGDQRCVSATDLRTAAEKTAPA